MLGFTGKEIKRSRRLNFCSACLQYGLFYGTSLPYYGICQPRNARDTVQVLEVVLDFHNSTGTP